MAFIDEVQIELKAGKGGNGVVRWRHEKSAPKGGPSGGNGGRGGNVYLEAVSDLTALARFRGHREFRADHGGDGMDSRKHGKDGDDLILNVPVGSYVQNKSTGKTFDFTKAGQRELVLQGGNGGRGNYVFRSSTNVTPMKATPGRLGEQAHFTIELRLVVDVGLIGLPNAGKSSLLNELTAAHARIGAYPFTTLEPNLGMFGELVLADIPGLIEGAAKGRGLGHKFLRHIQRTRVIAHCVSLEHQNLDHAYRTIRSELTVYGRGLDEKPELVVLTKSDLTEPDDIAKAVRFFKELGHMPVVVSIHDLDSIKALGRAFTKLAAHD